MTSICFATNNEHKLAEVRAITGPDFRILSLQEIGCHTELPETGQTLEENSLQKAQYVFDTFNVPCFADDTGLEVEALKGAPGVFSARYAGEHKSSTDNIRLLLKNLEHVTHRRARFRTLITLVTTKDTHVFEGSVEGIILNEERGKGGFGYDPVFVPDGYTKTFSEMSPEEKNRISHRAIATRKLTAYLIAHKSLIH